MYLSLMVLAILQSSVHGLDKSVVLQYVQKAVDDDTVEISETCRIDLQRFLNGVNSRETWALQMLDANGRIPRGLMRGNTMDFGFYDECLEVSEEFEENYKILGRYCTSGLVLPLNLTGILMEASTSSNLSHQVLDRVRKLGQFEVTRSETVNPDVPDYLLLASCLPDSCYPTDIFGDFGVDNTCTSRRETPAFDAGQIAFIVFFSLILLLMVISTTYDVYAKRLRKEPGHSLLLAFSVYTNGKKILHTSNARDQVSCFNGMKALSLFWVIAGHRYSSLDGFGIINPADALEWRDRWYAAYIMVAPLSVDTFLFVTGALMSYLFVKTMSRPKANFNIVLYYVHRYLRLTPALAVLWFLQVTLIMRMGSGPLYQLIFGYFRTVCLDSWWQFFLYIHNYYEDKCLSHTWYLALDMQLFIVSPFLLLPLVYYPRWTRNLVLPFITLASIIPAVVVLYVYDARNFSQEFIDHYYYKAYTRAAPWLIGLTFGGFFLKGDLGKKSYHIRQTNILLMWCATLTLMGVIIFTQRIVVSNDDRIESAIYGGLQRPIWALCLCWISFACTHGYGGVVNWFLSLPVFQIISKISYSTYLVHINVIYSEACRRRVLVYFDDYNGLYLVFADIVVSLAVGAFWALAFESPMIVIEKTMFGRGLVTQEKIEATKNCDNFSAAVNVSHEKSNIIHVEEGVSGLLRNKQQEGKVV